MDIFEEKRLVASMKKDDAPGLSGASTGLISASRGATTLWPIFCDSTASSLMSTVMPSVPQASLPPSPRGEQGQRQSEQVGR
mmetsp:Transcript_3708/g.9823  ORF Transcript_3708/g.9823 Transcript_3708/m.9823 type:complete len:82 (+) Transcript_3708:1-246(+)